MLETGNRRKRVILYFRGFAGDTVLAKSLREDMAYTSCRSLPAWLKYLPNNVSYTGKRTPPFGVHLCKST